MLLDTNQFTRPKTKRTLKINPTYIQKCFNEKSEIILKNLSLLFKSVTQFLLVSTVVSKYLEETKKMSNLIKPSL